MTYKNMLLDKEILNDAQSNYIRNGVTVLRNVLEEEWLEPMRQAIDQVLTNPGSNVMDFVSARNFPISMPVSPSLPTTKGSSIDLSLT